MFGTSITKESASGLLLMFAAAAAIVLDNSPLAVWYDRLLTVPFEIRLGTFELAKPLLLWINDGLMAIFFLLIGLEIKREVTEGELSRIDQAILPIVSAIGGVAFPAIVFVAVTRMQNDISAGWAIPAATDIAFALGILALLGSRVPTTLKILLTAIAIIDDLAAIGIIAIFYTANLSWLSLGVAAVVGVGLFILNRFRVTSLVPYMLLGAVLWVCVLKSGVHATLAGVVVALSIPMRVGERTPVVTLEHQLHPWVVFGIAPVFAFANAGIPLTGLSWESMVAPLPLAIALGLFVGKQVGIFGLGGLAIRLGWCARPAGTSWMQLYGVSLLAGVGFTMSLFIGTLAFTDPARQIEVRLGVVAGSLLSGLAGAAVLYLAGANRGATEDSETASESVKSDSSGPFTARSILTDDERVIRTQFAPER